MAFERLQNLGEDKWLAIMNHLQSGKPAMGLARLIQQEWGDFQDVAEKTLTQQLNRLRLAAAEGAFGKKIAKQIEKGATPQVQLLAGVSTDVIPRLEELANWQRERVISLKEKEKSMPIPVGSLLTQTNAVFNDYKATLIDIQKLRFELGLDTYKGVVTSMKGAAIATTLPDGTHVQKQVFEAMTTIDEIFQRHQIPEVSAKDVGV
jgi:DNA-binding HxlR family transcriptional regulator